MPDFGFWRSTRDPFCKIALICEAQRGDPAPSEVADHITAMRAGGDPTDMENLQGACTLCHNHKTATEDSTFAGEH
jgi:5-methylcytosine-specific restriction endonuclease McrA